MIIILWFIYLRSGASGNKKQRESLKPLKYALSSGIKEHSLALLSEIPGSRRKCKLCKISALNQITWFDGDFGGPSLDQFAGGKGSKKRKTFHQGKHSPVAHQLWLLQWIYSFYLSGTFGIDHELTYWCGIAIAMGASLKLNETTKISSLLHTMFYQVLHSNFLMFDLQKLQNLKSACHTDRRWLDEEKRKSRMHILLYYWPHSRSSRRYALQLLWSLPMISNLPMKPRRKKLGARTLSGLYFSFNSILLDWTPRRNWSYRVLKDNLTAFLAFQFALVQEMQMDNAASEIVMRGALE